jgi:hypothetical protein
MKTSRPAITLLLAVTLLGCGTTPAARVGGFELEADRLAYLIGQSRAIRLDENAAAVIAKRWVEYMIVGFRASEGNDLSDSALVVAMMWPDVRRSVVDTFRTALMAESVPLDSGAIRAAFADTMSRRVSHVLIKTDATMSGEQMAERRRVAERIRAALLAGGSWEAANESNEDQVARSHGGSIGVIARGGTVKPFEDAAFALAVGAYSPVVQTQFGYHVIYRPTLREAWDDFETAVRQRATRQFDSTYKASLLETSGLTMHADQFAAVRAAAEDVPGSLSSDVVLVSFRGGVFTVRDLALWLHVLTSEIQRGLQQASDERIESFLLDLVSQDLVYRAAVAAGYGLSADVYNRLAGDFEMQMSSMRVATGLFTDSLAGHSQTMDGRRARVFDLVDVYFDRALRNTTNYMPVPVFLADSLLRTEQWEVFPAVMGSVVERARSIRESLDPGSVGN